VNRALLSLHRGPLDNTRTVPLNPIIFSDEKNCKIVVMDATKYLQDKPPEVIQKIKK